MSARTSPWRRRLAAAFLLPFLAGPPAAADGKDKLSGELGIEGRFFFRNPLFAGQQRASVSLFGEIEYIHQAKNGNRFTVTPFVRWDSADSRRTHFDLREAVGLFLFGDFELRVGVSKVFWGVSESVHLVDIINQTDLIENIDGEEKLGQPMVYLSLAKDWGTIDLFYLPFFRERTFTGLGGRLRPGLDIVTRKRTFESSLKNWHPDFAARYSHSFGKFDVGLSYFRGTSRDPDLRLSLLGGKPVLLPHYPLIDQAGATAQYTTGAWLLKFEGLYRKGQRDARGRRRGYVASAVGFEYTFYSIFKTKGDLGLLGEYLYDSRQRNAAGPFQNDFFVGLRWAANDTADTTVLVGLIQDINGSSRNIFVEASRRINDSFKLEIEARIFMNPTRRDPIFSLRRDNFVQMKLVYSF
ncbi:MAG: hypothetical protein ACTSUD_03365 [Alphaproteobacteria bacterium]